MEELPDLNNTTDIFDTETQEQQPIIGEVETDGEHEEHETPRIVEDSDSESSDDVIVECSQEPQLQLTKVHHQLPQTVGESSEDEVDSNELDLNAIYAEAEAMLTEQQRKAREAPMCHLDIPDIFEGPQEVERRDEETIESLEPIPESEDDNPSDLDYENNEEEEEMEEEDEEGVK